MTNKIHNTESKSRLTAQGTGEKRGIDVDDVCSTVEEDQKQSLFQKVSGIIYCIAFIKILPKPAPQSTLCQHRNISFCICYQKGTCDIKI